MHECRRRKGLRPDQASGVVFAKTPQGGERIHEANTESKFTFDESFLGSRDESSLVRGSLEPVYRPLRKV